MEYFGIAIGCFVVIVGGLVLLFCTAAMWFYRRGQIDAMNGIVKYEKQTNSDGETVWVEKSK